MFQQLSLSPQTQAYFEMCSMSTFILRLWNGHNVQYEVKYAIGVSQLYQDGPKYCPELQHNIFKLWILSRLCPQLCPNNWINESNTECGRAQGWKQTDKGEPLTSVVTLKPQNMSDMGCVGWCNCSRPNTIQSSDRFLHNLNVDRFKPVAALEVSI